MANLNEFELIALAEENYQMTARYIRRYAEYASAIDTPFSEIKERLEALVEGVLENL